MKRWIRVLGSLPIAVPLLIAIAIVLAWGTIYEAQSGTAAVQRFVYQSWWFQTLLGFLAVNLAAAAWERYPWKRRHLPFVLAHVGIILVLLGGILGGRVGIEGQLVIPEGQAERLLQVPRNVLVVHQPNPGVQWVFPTQFETTAWKHQPHALFQVPLKDRTLQLVVDRYYPDAVTDEQITGDGADDNPAVRLLLYHGAEEEDVWLLARDPERFGLRWGEGHVLFLAPRDEAELAVLLGTEQPATPQRGVVTMEFPDLKVSQEIPVPDDMGKPLAIEGTPYTITFKDSFTDLAITEQGIVNRSAELRNPAVAFTLSGPEGTEPFLAFALHPDFEVLHGHQRAIHAHVTYRHGVSAALPPSAIVLVRHPAGALSAILTDDTGRRQVLACAVGQRYTHPTLAYQFEVREALPRAKVVMNFRNRSNEVRAEALHVALQDGTATAQAWVGLRQAVVLGGGEDPITVEYRQDQRELPFSVTLLDFRKTEYPGTEMAAAFESDVEVNDMERGLVMMRTIRMNHPLKYRGFSLFQSGYLPGPEETTVLSVRKDPGTPLVYAGFMIVILGVISMFVRQQPPDAAGQEGTP